MKNLLLIALIFVVNACDQREISQKSVQPVYKDIPYLQDYAVKYYAEDNADLSRVCTDRNENIQILDGNKLYWPADGRFQYPGKVVEDRRYEALKDKKITGIIIHQGQFVYIDDKAIFSNAWAGTLYIKHNLPHAGLLCGGRDFEFLISDGQKLQLYNKSGLKWQKSGIGQVLSIAYNPPKNLFIILTAKSLYTFSAENKKLDQIYQGSGLNCFEPSAKQDKIYIGGSKGYFSVDYSGRLIDKMKSNLPWPELTVIREINGRLWFGSTMGAFVQRDESRFNYYFGERWLPGKRVKDIQRGPDSSVLLLTDSGLSVIHFKMMTLAEKAMMFEKQVRKRHIRYGFNATIASLENHDLSTARLRKADSDNLWTSMYLAAELFRYLVTDSQEAKQNCYESFESLERLHNINNIKGLFGRTFERRGYQSFSPEYRAYVEYFWYPGYNNTISWHHADNEWDWRASASSDQTVGQVFAMTLIAEYITDAEWKKRAITILDDLMTYIVENNFTLVDIDGRPSLWGRWNPQYVNRFGTMVGDRKLYSSNIIAFLQSAYRHTGKEIYKKKAFELMYKYGYLENLSRPFSEIGQAPVDADEWSKMLSEEWNHSDDEMYFLSYWSLLPYAFNDSLKAIYRLTIKDHWNRLRPQKNALWNFCYAMTGAEKFDLQQAIWELKEWPLDMIEFAVKNSHRKDIRFMGKNYMGQTTTDVLPPDERPYLKHNKNYFVLDRGDRNCELSAGDTFLLPYWMGRFLGVISAPVKQE